MIIFNNVSKKFFNQSYGLNKVNFAVEPGEIVLITGPTGSGKTTLMRLLTKEYQPTEGEIVFNKTPLKKIKAGLLPQHRRQIGVVFQDYRLMPEDNVWENIALPLYIAGEKQDKIEERVTDLLRLVGLTDKADLFPRELSGGEAQRVGIARALATAPPVLFADEPTGNLDQKTARSIIKLLQKINQLETTVLIATHDVVMMDALNQVRNLKLDDGKLIADSKSDQDSNQTTTKQTEEKTDEITEEDEEKEEEEKQEKEKEKEKKEKEKTDKKEDDNNDGANEDESKENEANNKNKEDKEKKDEKNIWPKFILNLLKQKNKHQKETEA